MNFLYLKKVRVIISLIFLILTVIIFLNISEWFTSKGAEIITYLQFVPSLIKFLSIAGLSAAGFFIIIIITLIWGRVYCSSICPLGTYQDVVSFLARKFKKKKNHFLLKPYKILRYSILFLALGFVLSGSIFLVNLLDPFSISGKIISNGLRPLVLLVYNTSIRILEDMNLYLFFPVEIRNVPWTAVVIGFAFLILVTILSFRRGRIFCNSICPVGTLFGILSKFSIYQITIDESNCKSCNLCERECKAGCIDKVNKYIDFSRCVSCFNCFNACHSDGIVYYSTFKKKFDYEVEFSGSRKAFLKTLLFAFAGFSGFTFAQDKIIPKKQSTIPVSRKYPVSPPGSESIEKFTSSCTACHLCISACPTQVLQPSFLEYGFLGILQPRMDYHTSFCNYECVICSEVCPTGAIRHILREPKKLSQIGKAVFVKDNCIVYSEETACGACAEHCPTKAVSMIEPHKNLKAPKLNDKICIGCGACEFACPTKPYKAIYVEGNPVHLIAEKPKVEKLEEEINYESDFPF